MTNEEVAKRLALITGKPITEFFSGTINETETRRHDGIKNDAIHNTAKSGANNTNTTTKDVQQDKADVKKNPRNEVSGQILEYQKMFTGSRLSPDGSKIMGGRQMTRKEYLKYTRKMTSKEYYAHPLMFKIYRAEGQQEAAFPAFCDKFKKNDLKVKDEE